MSLAPVDVLAVGAHPDDVELGCGGTLAALARRGRTFGILDLTRGEAGTRGTPETRKDEAREAARILGATFRVTLDLGDGCLRTDRDAELQIVDVLRAARPRLVLAQHEHDRHPDHVRANRLVMDAWFYAGLRSLERKDPYHRSQQVLLYPSSYDLVPTMLVDVSETFETKLAAIRAYGTQFTAASESRSDSVSGVLAAAGGEAGPQTYISSVAFWDGITARARALGRIANVAYAEGLVSRLPPLVADPVAAFEGYEP